MNGNDMADVWNTLQKVKLHTRQQKPVIILMKTEMGFGVDFMKGTHVWHGKAPNAEQTEKALAQLPATIGDY
jgi:transketolase